jgi:hypothetical protein
MSSLRLLLKLYLPIRLFMSMLLLRVDTDVRKNHKNMVIRAKKLLWCYRHEVGEAGGSEDQLRACRTNLRIAHRVSTRESFRCHEVHHEQR